MRSDATTFELRDGALCAIDATGAIVRRHQAIGTRIVQLLPLGTSVVVREDYYRFPPDRSNLYCLDSGLRMLWSAEKPDVTDVYSNPVSDRSGVLVCASWEGVLCTLDRTSGRILRREFIK